MKPTICATMFGYQFKQTALLERALTHRSFSNTDSNERLEFLGDSVLSLIISEYVFERLIESNEGALSRVRAFLVKEQTLANIARSIKLGDHIKLGGGELKSGGLYRPSILSDTLEAIIAAIYMDGGFEAAKQSVLHLYQDYLKDLPDARLLKDPKTRLQEMLQARQLNLPDYVLTQTSGQGHKQFFTITCRIPALSIEAIGKGSSRKKAEQTAAGHLLQKLES